MYVLTQTWRSRNDQRKRPGPSARCEALAERRQHTDMVDDLIEAARNQRQRLVETAPLQIEYRSYCRCGAGIDGEAVKGFGGECHYAVPSQRTHRRRKVVRCDRRAAHTQTYHAHVMDMAGALMRGTVGARSAAV